MLYRKLYCLECGCKVSTNNQHIIQNIDWSSCTRECGRALHAQPITTSRWYLRQLIRIDMMGAR
jgi:hypothetical protein